MSKTKTKEIEAFRWHQMLVALLFVVPMFYAGIVGFVFRGIYYGFKSGMESFDEYFETDASKINKSNRS
jgi:hypothetical protein